jgi:hypothetical protein
MGELDLESPEASLPDGAIVDLDGWVEVAGQVLWLMVRLN